MKKESSPPQELSEEIYSNPLPVKRLVMVAMAIFFLAFLMNFPIKKNIITLVTSALNKNRACPITYDKVDVSFLLIPSITIKNPSLVTDFG